jgi:hypothetical protein
LTGSGGMHFGLKKSKLRFGELTAFEISGEPVKAARNMAKMESEGREARMAAPYFVVR